MARTPKVVEDRREQIIDAAMSVFARKGFTRATNKDIAQEAGITPGLIYHYFENKNALLQAIMEARSPLRLIRSIPTDRLALPPAQFLPAFIIQALQIIESDTFVKIIRVFLPELIHHPDLAVPIHTLAFPKVIDFFSHYYAQQIQLGNIRPSNPTDLANLTLSCVLGFVLRRQIIRDPSVLSYTQEQLAQLASDTILNGILPN